MPPFLSPSWLEQLTLVAGGHQVGPGAVVVQQVVTGGPDGEVSFVLEVEAGHLRARPGRDAGAVVTLTEAWETAVRIHRGELTAQEAFREGLVKVRGDVRRLVEAAATLGSLGSVTAGPREQAAGA